MNRLELINELAGTLHALTIGPQEKLHTITFGQMAEAVVEKALALKVLVIHDEGEIDELDLAPGARMPALLEPSVSFNHPLVAPAPVVYIPPTVRDPREGLDAAEEITDPEPLPEGQLLNSWEVLRTAMQNNGVLAVRLDFSGGGDDGSVNDYIVEPEGITIANINVPAVDGHYPQYCRGGVVNGMISMDNFAEGLYWDISEHAGHGGWYNDSGGFGHITFRADTGRIDLNHNESYEESTLNPHAFQ